jgi:hypothetical protein
MKTFAVPLAGRERNFFNVISIETIYAVIMFLYLALFYTKKQRNMCFVNFHFNSTYGCLFATQKYKEFPIVLTSYF